MCPENRGNNENETMKFSEFSFFMTDDCNFACTYCPQQKEKKYMKKTTIEKASSFFYPYLEDEVDIVFFGGEPLLTFDMAVYAVDLLEERNKKRKKKLKFNLATNGSLLTDEMLHFFNLHGFKLALSFDGLAQDMSRQPGSLRATRERIPCIRSYPGIVFSINAVFTPGTVSRLTASVEYIIEAGGTDITINLSETEPWDDGGLITLERELERLTDFLLLYYQDSGTIPVTYFRPSESPPKKGFICIAGRKRMSVSPEEYLWGCCLFHPYLKNKEKSDDFRIYSFGKLDDFFKNHQTIYPRVLANYAVLKQDSFFTEKQFCFLCEDVDYCCTCPAYAAYSTSFIGKIPTWSCSISRILRKKREEFLEKINPIQRKEKTGHNP